MKASCLIKEDDQKVDDIDKSVAVLELNQNFIFGDAGYEINKGRQTKLRKPEMLPDESDVQALRQYIWSIELNNLR